MADKLNEEWQELVKLAMESEVSKEEFADFLKEKKAILYRKR